MRPAGALVLHEGILGVVLVPELVGRLGLALAHEEAVGAVDDEARIMADAAVAVDYALGNEGRPGIVHAHGHFHAVAIGGALGPVVPEGELEVARAEPAEEVRLLHVLMGPAQHAGVGHAHVGHLGSEPGRQLVVPEDLRQPAALVHELPERHDHHTFDGSLGEGHA